MDILMMVIWGILILTLIFELPNTLERLRMIKAGLRALIFLPVLWIVTIVSMVSAVYASEVFPILKWGWLGYNVITAPVSETISDKVADPTMTLGIGSIVLFVGIFFIIIYACLLCNYYEEAYYRGSLLMVVIWAALHIIMGIPLFAAIPIFFMGIIYKYVYDKYSLNHSYCLHFFMNLSVISLVIISFVSYFW